MQASYLTNVALVGLLFDKDLHFLVTLVEHSFLEVVLPAVKLDHLDVVENFT